MQRVVGNCNAQGNKHNANLPVLGRKALVSFMLYHHVHLILL